MLREGLVEKPWGITQGLGTVHRRGGVTEVGVGGGHGEDGARGIA